QAPVVIGAAQVDVRAAAAHALAQGGDVAVRLAQPEKHRAGGALAGGDLQIDAESRVDRSLLDGFLRKDAVLRVDEGPAGVVEAFLAGREPLHAEAVRAHRAEDDVALPFVMDQAARLGIVEDGVAQVVAEEAQVVVPEDAHLAGAAAQVFDLDFADEQRVVEVDAVGAAQAQAERLVGQLHVRDERVAAVGNAALPGFVLDPGEAAVGLDAHAAYVAVGLVLPGDAGP